MIDDLHKFERSRREPDHGQRFRRHDDADGAAAPPRRRARLWVVVALAVVLVAIFALLLATDDGEPDEPFSGAAPAGVRRLADD